MSSDVKELNELARFQAVVLEVLARGADPRTTREALLSRADLAPFHPYIANWEDRMIEVAEELVKKWGRR